MLTIRRNCDAAQREVLTAVENGVYGVCATAPELRERLLAARVQAHGGDVLGTAAAWGQALAGLLLEYCQRATANAAAARQAQWLQSERDALRQTLDKYYADPLMEQVRRLEQDGEEKQAERERLVATLARANSALDAERRAHAESVARLEQQIADLNRILVEQQERLHELQGE